MSRERVLAAQKELHPTDQCGQQVERDLLRSCPGILHSALESRVQESPTGVNPVNRLFPGVCRGRTRTNGFMLKVGRFSLGIREKCFMLRVVRNRNRLPRESVDALLLEVFKVMLDEALSNLVW